jgi:hypothetical protein
MCDDRERLLGYLYNEGDDAERRNVEQHLEGCETCREELGGLRATRQDLLAWDVPEHGSVWKPFVPANAAPRWRDIPAWAMAAAASLTFIVGAAGGVLTHAMFEKNVAAADQTAATTPPQPAAPRVAPAELSAIEQRMLRDMRAELAAIQQASARATLPPMQLVGMRPQEVSERISTSEKQQLDYISDVNNRLVQYKRETNARLENMTRTLEMLTNALMSQQSGK